MTMVFYLIFKFIYMTTFFDAVRGTILNLNLLNERVKTLITTLNNSIV